MTGDSPAAAAGVLVGDVLLEFDGHAVESPEELLDLLLGDRVGPAGDAARCCAAARLTDGDGRRCGERAQRRESERSSRSASSSLSADAGLLVGSPASARGCGRSSNGSIDVAGEFATLAAARAAGRRRRRDSRRRRRADASRCRRRRFDEPLTPREVQVLELLAEGLPNKAIADAARHQRSDGQVPRLVDLGQARRRQSHRRGAPRGPARPNHAVIRPRSSGRHDGQLPPPRRSRRIVSVVGTPMRSSVSRRCRSSTPVTGFAGERER